MFDLWFTDVDTFPLISTGRIDSPDAILAIFSSPLMQGLMPNALFYRPLTSLTWGIDALVWGLNPLGYHLTDLAIHLANSLLLFYFVHSAAQRFAAANTAAPSRIKQADLAALVAAFIFAIHPIGMEVVPAIARRPDLLFGLFLLLMLRTLDKALEQPRGLYSGLATLYCVLGFAAKDTALVLPGIALVFVFSFSRATSFAGRLGQCARLCWPLVVAAALFLVARALVLGGLGGYAGADSFLESASGSLYPYLCGIFYSGNLETCTGVSRSRLLGAAAIMFVSMALLCWRTSRDHPPFMLPLRFMAFSLLSLLALVVLHASAGTAASVRTMYAPLLFVSIAMGWSLVLIPQAIARRGSLHGSRIAERSIHVIAGLILLAAAGSLLRGAWTGQYIKEWQATAEVARVALTDLATGLSAVPADSVVYLVNFPFAVGSQPRAFRERPIILEHSVQGFVDLVAPDKQLEVVGLSYLRISLDDPAGLASSIRFQPAPARLTIETGPEGSATRRVWFVRFPRKSPWRDNMYSRNNSERQMFIDLNPAVDLRDHAVFFIYTGNGVVQRGITAWIVDHVPAKP